MDIVDEEVVLSVFVICATKKIDFLLNLDAVVARPWSEVALPVRENLPPLADLHVHEVLACEARLCVALANPLHCAGGH